MKNLLMLALVSFFILNSCNKNSSNPVIPTTIPSAPSQIFPVNASVGIAVVPTISWNSSSGAASYTLQVSSNSSFSSFTYNQNGLIDTTKQVILLNPSSIYYWRVSAANAAGISGWSNEWSFTTTGPSPAVPLLSSPPNGATISSPFSLGWIVSSGASSYTLQVSLDSLFTSFAYNDTLSTTSKQVMGLIASTYYWRVRASNSNGPSGWSTVWSVKTAAPTAPALSSPLNGATAISLLPLLSWSASGGASSFKLQVSLNSSFTSFVYDLTGLTSLNYQVTIALPASTLYYWRVSASNGYGTSGWTDTWSFTTQ